MSKPFSLAIDAMGGDNAPDIVLDGLELAAERHPEARFLLVGDETRIGSMLARRPKAARLCMLRHAPDLISSEMKPTAALRQGRQSSMRIAIDSVAAGEAAGVVSAGNTGALMALAKIVIKTLPEIDRPALGPLLARHREEGLDDARAAIRRLADFPRALAERGPRGQPFEHHRLRQHDR